MPAPRPKLTRGPLAQRALLGKQCPTYASASHKPRARSLLFKFAKAPCQDKIPKASARYIITVGLFSHIKEPFFVFARERLVGAAGKLRDLHGKGCGGGPGAERQETQTSCSPCWQRDGDGDSRAGATRDCPTDDGTHVLLVVAEPGHEMGVNLLRANHRWCIDRRARCKIGICSPNPPCRGLGTPCACVWVPPAVCGHGDHSEVAQQPWEQGNPGPHAAPDGAIDKEGWACRFKVIFPRQLLHPSPEGLWIRRKHGSPAAGWETQGKMKIGTIPPGFYSPSLPSGAGSSVGYHWHHFLDLDISAPEEELERDGTEAKGVWL